MTEILLNQQLMQGDINNLLKPKLDFFYLNSLVSVIISNTFKTARLLDIVKYLF